MDEDNDVAEGENSKIHEEESEKKVLRKKDENMNKDKIKKMVIKKIV